MLASHIDSNCSLGEGVDLVVGAYDQKGQEHGADDAAARFTSRVSTSLSFALHRMLLRYKLIFTLEYACLMLALHGEVCMTDGKDMTDLEQDDPTNPMLICEESSVFQIGNTLRSSKTT